MEILLKGRKISKKISHFVTSQKPDILTEVCRHLISTVLTFPCVFKVLDSVGNV